MAQEPLALALASLSRRERSVSELGTWLRGRGVSEEEVGSVLEHLVSVGALDDARFAERFAEDKRELAGWGAGRIRTALERRGVAAAEIEAALETNAPEEELERAASLVRARGIDLGDDRGRGRAFGLLVRRGYDSETAYEAIRLAAGFG